MILLKMQNTNKYKKYNKSQVRIVKLTLKKKSKN